MRKIVLCLAVGTAIIIRLLVVQSWPSLMPGIEMEYIAIADSIRDGSGYYVTTGQVPIEYMLPGYAYFRAVFPHGTTMLIDAVLGVIMIYALMCYAGYQRASIAAAILYALMCPAAIVAGWPLPDALTNVFYLASLLSVVAIPDWRGAAMAGFVLGVAGWFRGDLVAFVPLLGVVTWRRGAFALVAAWLIPTIALGLFWLSIYDTFSLSRPGSGLLLWEGLGQQANVWNIVPTDDAAIALLSANGLRYGTSEGDSFLLHEWAKHVAENPKWFIATVVARFSRIMRHWHGYLLLIPATLGFVLVRRKHKLLMAICLALWLSRIVPFTLMRDEVRFIAPTFIVYIVGIGLLAEIRVKQPISSMIHPLPSRVIGK